MAKITKNSNKKKKNATTPIPNEKKDAKKEILNEKKDAKKATPNDKDDATGAPGKKKGAKNKRPGAGRKSAYTGMFVHRKAKSNPYREGSTVHASFEDIPSSGGMLFDTWRLKAGPELASPRRLHLANMIRAGHAVLKKIV